MICSFASFVDAYWWLSGALFRQLGWVLRLQLGTTDMGVPVTTVHCLKGVGTYVFVRHFSCTFGSRAVFFLLFGITTLITTPIYPYYHR